ncbi:chymotrypsinogen B-like [Dipodomys merriami]|uniref:chymotrypsinogen B-like n=1 Tax=Dipodomys merriami TaxID=94247 RepID=UPI0038556ECB
MLGLWLLGCWAVLGAAFAGQEGWFPSPRSALRVAVSGSESLSSSPSLASQLQGVLGERHRSQLPLLPRPPVPRCGIPAIPPEVSGLSRVVNGEDAVPGSWPWQVSIQYEDSFHFCGGALISEEWVLTAAHCGVMPGDKVVAGAFNLDSDEKDVQVLDVAEVFSKPGKVYSKPVPNDIALLKLATPACFTDTVSAVCLACDEADFPPGTPCVITGWGQTQYDDHQRAPTLRQAVLPLVSTPDCRKYWGDNVTDDMICAGGNGTSPCIGDSGGALVCEKGGVWSQVGIVSWGSDFCCTDTPAVFTRITAVLDWVKQTLEEN